MGTDLAGYTYRGISGSYIEYARFLFDTLKADPRFSGLIADAKIPGIDQIRRASVSSAAGVVFAAIAGIGWSKGTRGAILLRDCPLDFITITERSEWAGLRFFFVVREERYGNAVIKPIRKGLFGGRLVGVEINGHLVPGLDGMQKDQKLKDEILSLFHTSLVTAYEQVWPPKILIRFEKNLESQLGLVESGVLRSPNAVHAQEKAHGSNYVQVNKRLLDVAIDLASRIKASCV